jgi:hypothetical protein
MFSGCHDYTAEVLTIEILMLSFQMRNVGPAMIVFLKSLLYGILQSQLQKGF